MKHNLLTFCMSVISNEGEKSYLGAIRFLAVLEMTRSSKARIKKAEFQW